MLSSNQMSELSVMMRATSAPASKYMYIHVVDVEYHQLVQAWLVVANTKQPVIEKVGQTLCRSKTPSSIFYVFSAGIQRSNPKQ